MREMSAAFIDNARRAAPDTGVTAMADSEVAELVVVNGQAVSVQVEVDLLQASYSVIVRSHPSTNDWRLGPWYMPKQ